MGRKKNEELETMLNEETAETADSADSTEAPEEAAEKANQKPKSETDYLEELVEVMLFKDSDRYSDDVPVTLNGKTWLIKRGVKVMVPRKVKLVLDDAMKQGGIAADCDEEAQRQYKEFENRL